jgi:putative membrane protein insertion efficiency factor
VVFDGPWRRRRRQYPDNPGYGPYDPQDDPRYDPRYDPGYDPRYRRGYGGYGYRGGQSSCLRDLLFLDAGCCLAEGLGCGGNLLLVAPAALRRARVVGGGPGRLRRWLLTMIAVYQRQISPRRPACCRFSPTCSHYAAEALRRYGVGRGLWLAGRRLLRCRPGAARGWDPVPLPPA